MCWTYWRSSMPLTMTSQVTSTAQTFVWCILPSSQLQLHKVWDALFLSRSTWSRVYTKSSLFYYPIFDTHIWLLNIKEFPPMWTHSAWPQLEIHCQMHWWRWLLNTVLSIPFCVLHRKEGGNTTWESSLLRWDQGKRTREWLVRLHRRHLKVANSFGLYTSHVW